MAEAPIRHSTATLLLATETIADAQRILRNEVPSELEKVVHIVTVKRRTDKDMVRDVEPCRCRKMYLKMGRVSTD